MSYDVAFRHQQALDPSALATITAALHAITTAIDDCRNAGKNAETDPAVILLARHLGTIAGAGSDESLLRRRCIDTIAELRRFPALLTLAVRGVAHDAAAKDRFHADGRKAMRRLADALGLEDGRYRIHSNRSHPSQSGEITLHGEEVHVQLSLGAPGPDSEVIYRRVDGLHDCIGDVRRFASIRDLLAPDRFAARLRRELRLSAPRTYPVGLFA